MKIASPKAVNFERPVAPLDCIINAHKKARHPGYKPNTYRNEDGSYTLHLHAGAHVHLQVEPGKWLGFDDGRLDVITEWIMRHDQWFEDRRILDIGSNVGHFPCVYSLMARQVLAIEPNYRNVEFFYVLMEMLGGIENVDVIEADLRQVGYAQIGQIDVLSTLGLIYHLHEPFAILGEVIGHTRPKLWLLESQLWQADHEDMEDRFQDGIEGEGLAFEAEMVLHPTADLVEREVERLGFKPCRIDLGGSFHSNDGSERGFWACVR